MPMAVIIVTLWTALAVGPGIDPASPASAPNPATQTIQNGSSQSPTGTTSSPRTSKPIKIPAKKVA